MHTIEKSAEAETPKKAEAQKVTGAEKEQRRLLKKRRGGAILSKDEVLAIKAGRKKLRKEMKAMGIKSRKEFELTASSLGLYFDKSRLFPFLWWFHGRGLWALLGALAVLMATLFLFSAVKQMRGHFTINISDGMFREGFSLSETIDFKNATTQLFAEPAIDVPCISIGQIPADVDSYDGSHNASYFAYSFYLRNEGESTVDYEWGVQLNSESQSLAEAVWVMVFEDGEMGFYAKPSKEGEVQALPPMGDNSRGYMDPELMPLAKHPTEQYQLIRQVGNHGYYRVIPKTFADDLTVTSGIRENVVPWQVHKYTIVIWLEGDDPDCTDELIGGHLGLEINMRMLEEETEDGSGAEGWRSHWKTFWDNLIFWED